MAICPECMSRIDTLECVEEGVQVTPMDRYGEYDHGKTTFDTGIFPQTHWGCPLCLHPIAFSYETAVAFLNDGEIKDDI